MSTYIDLDSFYRDRASFPNPFDYELNPSQVESWFRTGRSVQEYTQKNVTRPLEFAVSISVESITIPYNEFLSNQPKIYINFRSRDFNDVNLIQTIDGVHPTAKFSCFIDKIQHNSDGEPIWLHYKCTMNQTMRFKRHFPVVIRFFDRTGETLSNPDRPFPQPPNPFAQSLCVFKLVSYIRDAEYDNHFIQPLIPQ